MNQTSPGPHSNRPLLLGFALVLMLGLWTLSRGWHASIMDRHDFRQIQTAFSIQWMKETGFQAAYETPLFGPPWAIPMEFPVYQGIVAQLSSSLGTGLEPTARAVSVAFLLLMLPAVFLLAGHLGLRGHHRLWPVATTLLTPLYLFYGRTVMIETTAACLSVWFLYGFVRTVRERHLGFALLATLCAVGAALAKITTFLAFVPAAGVALWWFGDTSWRDRLAPAGARATALGLAAMPFAAALVATLAWVRFSDRLKAANPFADFLTSQALWVWNWGTWDQRFEPGFWAEIAHSLKAYVFSPASLTILAVGLTLCTRTTRAKAAVALGLFLAGPLLFTNLYWRHDYYFCANAVLLLVAAGLVLADATGNPGLPVALRRLLPLLFFTGQWFGYQTNFGDYTRRALPSAPGVATAIEAATPPEGVVLIYGWDWNATVPYYAHRRAIMVRNGYEDDVGRLDQIIAELPPLRIAALLVHNPSLQRSPTFIREHTERFGLAPTPLVRSAAGDLYVSEDVFLTAAQALRDRLPEDTTLNVSFDRAPVDAGLTDHPADTVSLPSFHPAPTRARAMHGFVMGEHEGQPSLMAHPTAELHFTPPETARRVVVNYGIYPGAYAPEASSVTDGVTFEILEVRPNGVRRLLFRRTLDPVNSPDDRGTQSEELDAGPFRGVLVFRTTPGPAGRFNSDWSYWSRIEIR